jgi:UDP-glucose 4-epimerase
MHSYSTERILPIFEGKTVLVTGGAGHIGSHIVDEIPADVKRAIIYDNFAEGRESNIEHLTSGKVELVRRDIRDYEDLNKAMKGVDYVFHTASILLLECRDHPDKALDVNVKGTYNVIRACIENKVKKVVFSTTGSVYGDPLYMPMDENHPYNSETLYGTTKIAGEHLFRDFYRSNGLQYVGLRYFNIYGPRQHYKGAYAQIIPRWFDKVLYNGLPLVINGDGTQTMDMTYVTDVAKANILAMVSDVTNDFINVGTGKQWSIVQIKEAMERVVGYKLPATFIPQDVNLVKRRQCSTEKAKKLIGFEAEVQIEEGLRRYYDWRQGNS